jgi:hypothetical protein
MVKMFIYSTDGIMTIYTVCKTFKIQIIGLITILMMAFISHFIFINYMQSRIIMVGDPLSPQCWVYLSGLMEDRDCPRELSHRAILDDIGKQLHVRIIAVFPKTRSERFNNMLNWPQHSNDELLETYIDVIQQIGNIPITGWIGFSNGGFFLNRLSQTMAMNAPIISIGSGGDITSDPYMNHIILLIGKDDTIQYPSAHKYYKQSLGTRINVELNEYEGGHMIDSTILKDTMDRFGF